jgi:hypothetical protein
VRQDSRDWELLHAATITSSSILGATGLSHPDVDHFIPGWPHYITRPVHNKPKLHQTAFNMLSKEPDSRLIASRSQARQAIAHNDYVMWQYNRHKAPLVDVQSPLSPQARRIERISTCSCGNSDAGDEACATSPVEDSLPASVNVLLNRQQQRVIVMPLCAQATPTTVDTAEGSLTCKDKQSDVGCVRGRAYERLLGGSTTGNSLLTSAMVQGPGEETLVVYSVQSTTPPAGAVLGSLPLEPVVVCGDAGKDGCTGREGSDSVGLSEWLPAGWQGGRTGRGGGRASKRKNSVWKGKQNGSAMLSVEKTKGLRMRPPLEHSPSDIISVTLCLSVARPQDGNTLFFASSSWTHPFSEPPCAVVQWPHHDRLDMFTALFLACPAMPHTNELPSACGHTFLSAQSVVGPTLSTKPLGVQVTKLGCPIQ